MNTLELMQLDGGSISIDPRRFESLRAGWRGQLLTPADAAYEPARQIHNMIHDRRPGLIARCSGVADVKAAATFASDHQLLTAVRGGGHGVPGFSSCNGGLLMDLSLMQSVRVDPVRRIARAEGGTTWGTFYHETQAFGLATTGGVNRPTGIAGLTLGGGHGFLMRSCGLSVDNLLSVDMVTARGELVTANESENADLFWALRGGGGNFGVVTSFEYRLHPVGPLVLAGVVAWPMEQAGDVLAFYREWTRTLPDEMGTFIVAATLATGVRVFSVLCCWHGPVEDGERYVAPLRKFGQPLLDQLQPMPYIALQSISETLNPAGIRNYWKSTYFDDLAPKAAEILVSALQSAPHAHCHLVIEQLGGAISRVPDDATAVDFRSARFGLLIIGMWENAADDQPCIAWVRDLAQALEPYASAGSYVNYVDNELDGNAAPIARLYTVNKRRRLAAIKQRYDPNNLFRLNQNIRPEA